jgi:hypothetical protein
VNPAQLAREDQAHLVRLFKQAERSTRRTPDGREFFSVKMLKFIGAG